METDKLYDLSELFKIFGDPTRLKILYALYDNEHTVSEITQLVNMNASAISHQLKTLRTSKLITSRRDGKYIYYSLADDHVKMIIAMGKEHIEE